MHVAHLQTVAAQQRNAQVPSESEANGTLLTILTNLRNQLLR